MKRSAYLTMAAAFLLAFLSVSGQAQILLNELDINPGGTDNGCEYVELIGPPGAAVENIYFVSLEGDSNKGMATGFIGFGTPGPVIGSNGLLVVVSAAGCGTRTYPAGTTVITTTFLNGGVLQNGSNSFLLISSPTTPIGANDYDTDDNGTLDALPADAVILDSVAWLDGDDSTDVIYGTQLIASGTVIGGATRFAGDTRANNSRAWYAGVLVGAPADTTYSATVRTANFPANGALTPGAVNIGTAVRDAPVDLTGDGKTDYVVVRPAGGAGSQLTWFNAINGGNPSASRNWGVSGDTILAGDYDGDGKDDETVWRSSDATFYIIQSATLTMRIDQFGQAGDNPRVVGDYNGDGRDDLAVYRSGTQSVWYYKTSPSVYFDMVEWGQVSDVPAPGDYDGDGKADYVVKRAEGANARFYKRTTSPAPSGGTQSSEVFGSAADTVAPGDYDGDGKTDVAVIRLVNGFYTWDFEPSGTAGSTVVSDTWGVPGDVITQGDYDGDGKTDYSIWRPGAQGTFFVMTVGDRRIFTKEWGQTGDFPAANYNTFN